jgi:hypothetical protein
MLRGEVLQLVARPSAIPLVQNTQVHVNVREGVLTIYTYLIRSAVIITMSFGTHLGFSHRAHG